MPSTKGREKIISAGDSLKKKKKKNQQLSFSSETREGEGEVLETKDHRLFLVLPRF